MRGSPRNACLGVILCSLTGAAGAAPLSVVNVTAPDINCVFETDCTIVVTDRIGNLPVCAADSSGPGHTTFFFGLASQHPPKAITATVEAPGVFPDMHVKARGPNH